MDFPPEYPTRTFKMTYRQMIELLTRLHTPLINSGLVTIAVDDENVFELVERIMSRPENTLTQHRANPRQS